MKKRKLALYEKYLQDSREDKEKETLAEQVGRSADSIVIQKVSTGGKIIEKVLDIAYLAGKIFITITIIGLISLAVTVLINHDLRNTVVTQLMSSF